MTASNSFRLPAFALALVTVAGTTSLHGQQRQTYLRPSVELRLKVPAEIERLEIAATDIRKTRAERTPLSDLMLRLTPETGAVDVALQLPNVQRPPPRADLFRVEIYTVVAGRIGKDILAACERWQDDVALCHVDCEGGSFGLRRGARGQGLSMIVGRLPRGDYDPSRPGLSLGSCNGAADIERAIVPRTGRPVVELQLGEE